MKKIFKMAFMVSVLLSLAMACEETYQVDIEFINDSESKILVWDLPYSDSSDEVKDWCRLLEYNAPIAELSPHESTLMQIYISDSGLVDKRKNEVYVVVKYSDYENYSKDEVLKKGYFSLLRFSEIELETMGFEIHYEGK